MHDLAAGPTAGRAHSAPDAVPCAAAALDRAAVPQQPPRSVCGAHGLLGDAQESMRAVPARWEWDTPRLHACIAFSANAAEPPGCLGDRRAHQLATFTMSDFSAIVGEVAARGSRSKVGAGGQGHGRAILNDRSVEEKQKERIKPRHGGNHPHGRQPPPVTAAGQSQCLCRRRAAQGVEGLAWCSSMMRIWCVHRDPGRQAAAALPRAVHRFQGV